jgi:hypothetical protein
MIMVESLSLSLSHSLDNIHTYYMHKSYSYICTDLCICLGTYLYQSNFFGLGSGYVP